MGILQEMKNWCDNAEIENLYVTWQLKEVKVKRAQECLDALRKQQEEILTGYGLLKRYRWTVLQKEVQTIQQHLRYLEEKALKAKEKYERRIEQ